VNAEQWRSRPLYSRTLTRCNHCGELREDVQNRQQFYPAVRAESCHPCYQKLVAEASGWVVY